MIYTIVKLQQRIISMKYNTIYHSKTLIRNRKYLQHWWWWWWRCFVEEKPLCACVCVNAERATSASVPMMMMMANKTILFNIDCTLLNKLYMNIRNFGSEWHRIQRTNLVWNKENTNEMRNGWQTCGAQKEQNNWFNCWNN